MIFSYPRSFSDDAVLQNIRLEIGALAAWTPAKWQSITPYAAQQYERLFERPTTRALTVLPERSFWEKATILHREAFRDETQLLPERYSRHYYDLYRMANTSVKATAIADEDLLNRVVQFKEKFYHCAFARYDLAKRGTLRLLPPSCNLKKLDSDYTHMQNMLFGYKPSFNEVLEGLRRLTDEINDV